MTNIEMARLARGALGKVSTSSTRQKNQALEFISKSIVNDRQTILKANGVDLKRAEAHDLEPSLLDRLELNNAILDSMIESISQIMALPDPVGEISKMTRRPSGIEVGLMRQPIGVIGIIYESRPNVTIDASALCIKSGNACVLRGGSEAFQSNQALARCITEGLELAKLPGAVVQVAPTASRSFIDIMIGGTKPMCDIVIPRGGQGLIQRISQDAKVPVIKHLDGNCHVYVDSDADLDKALRILENSKTHRYGVCNAAESFLINEKIANEFLPRLAAMLNHHNVEIRGCDRVCGILTGVKRATLEDWVTEYLGPVVAIAIVNTTEDAIRHINKYGSHHTDAIVSENYAANRAFLAAIDSASVIVNASTRFADGFEYGLGAEVGISTDRIHVRGPVGLKGLTNEKWVVLGDGEVRQ